MAEQATMWRDSLGGLHYSETEADRASAQYERDGRSRAVRQLLTARLNATVPPALRQHSAPFDSTREAVDWLITNWPAIKAIGFAYRLDDLAPPAKE